MARFHFILLALFWCASLSITVFQQSSVLSDLKQLWTNRVETEIQIDKKLDEITNALQKRQQQSSSSSSSSTESTVEDLLRSLKKLETSTIKTVNELAKQIHKKDQQQEEEQHRLAVEQDEEDHKTQKSAKKKSWVRPSLPKLKSMRTECKNYGALDALRHLMKNARSKLYEPNAGDMLRQFAEEGGPNQVNIIKMDPRYANLNGQVENVLDHLEKTMPEILDLWWKWFKNEDGDPIPAPKFLSEEEGGKVHFSEAAGRKAYEEVISKM